MIYLGRRKLDEVQHSVGVGGLFDQAMLIGHKTIYI